MNHNRQRAAAYRFLAGMIENVNPESLARVGGDSRQLLSVVEEVRAALIQSAELLSAPGQMVYPQDLVLGWNPDGSRRDTGIPQIDAFVSGLQDAEDCMYRPVDLFKTVDLAGDDVNTWWEGYDRGRVELADGTVYERGGALRTVWTCVRLGKCYALNSS